MGKKENDSSKGSWKFGWFFKKDGNRGLIHNFDFNFLLLDKVLLEERFLTYNVSDKEKRIDFGLNVSKTKRGLPNLKFNKV